MAIPNASLNITCRWWFILMCIDSKCKARWKRPKKKEKKLQIRQRRNMNIIIFINKLTMSTKIDKYIHILYEQWTMNQQPKTQMDTEDEKTTRLICISFSFIVQYSVCCCCTNLFVVIFHLFRLSFVSFLRKSFPYKCQTYLPVKYLIYSSVYFNFDLVRAFHFNLRCIFVSFPPFLTLFRFLSFTIWTFWSAWNAYWYQYPVSSIQYHMLIRSACSTCLYANDQTKMVNKTFSTDESVKLFSFQIDRLIWSRRMYLFQCVSDFRIVERIV